MISKIPCIGWVAIGGVRGHSEKLTRRMVLYEGCAANQSYPAWGSFRLQCEPTGQTPVVQPEEYHLVRFRGGIENHGESGLLSVSQDRSYHGNA
jgi:hypothetical protein